MLRTSIFLCSFFSSSPTSTFFHFETIPMKLIYLYDTSSFKRKQLAIDGDVELNPGPVSSVESYRAAIGRHNGKFRLRETVTTFNGKRLTSCLLKIMLVFILFYSLSAALIITCRTYIPYLLALLVTNCYSLSVFCQYSVLVLWPKPSNLLYLAQGVGVGDGARDESNAISLLPLFSIVTTLEQTKRFLLVTLFLADLKYSVIILL